MAINYKEAGVDIEAGAALVDAITPMSHSRPGVLSSIGGFNALFELPSNYQQPVLVSCTDGVGTKVLIAKQLQRYDTIGIDLVAMCVNDMIVSGAEPLFFLDYYATGKLDVDTAAAVIAGINEGCKQSNMALIGGETAEMPGVYANNDYDLAGFSVGVVEKHGIIDGQHIEPGMKLIALASSGVHANGFSLVRKILSDNNIALDSELNGTELGQQLLAPTKIYVSSVRQLLTQHPVYGMAHITGGGLTENIPRCLPEHCQATINLDSWQQPALFGWLAAQADLAQPAMLTTFNCGVGMVLCVDADKTDACLASLTDAGEQAWVIGDISKRGDSQSQIEFTGAL